MPQGRELFLSAEASLAAYFNLIPGSSNLDENRTIQLNPIPIPLLPDRDFRCLRVQYARVQEQQHD